MGERRRSLAPALLPLLLWGACGGGDGSQPAGPRPTPPGLLAIDANPRTDPPPQEEDYLRAVDLVQEAGGRAIALSYTWSALEPRPGALDLNAVQDSIDLFGVSRNLTVLLGIQMINTVRREVPPDLVDEPWDSPRMRARFSGLLDRLAPLFRDRVRYAALGNEVDVYFDTRPAEWASFRRFYETAASDLRQRAPGVRVGVTGTFDGVTGNAGREYAALNTTSDVVILTYYPLDGAFQVRDPASPILDFQRMLQVVPGKPVILQEIGMPSGAPNGSDEARQAAFVRSTFAAWQSSNGQIPLLSFFLLHDLDPGLCAELSRYYGLEGVSAFESYLCTLGLRRANGTPKAAWQALLDAAQAAGLR